MVITFDTRLQCIKNRCAPFLGKRSFDMEIQASSNAIPTTKLINVVSKGIDGSQRHTCDTDDVCQMNRHKRQRQELAYAAATIEAALEQAGRPSLASKTLRRERALPSGSVDLNLAKIVDSLEYDDASKASRAADGFDTIDNGKDFYKAFYANYSSLVQSTRQYYISSSSESKFTNDQNEKKSESSSSMEGLSSWTSNSSNQDLNDNKEIDNDNRSDQSSLDADDSIADSSSCESRSPFQEVANKNEKGAAFSVIG